MGLGAIDGGVRAVGIEICMGYTAAKTYRGGFKMIVKLISPETEYPHMYTWGSAAAITRGVTFDEFLNMARREAEGHCKQCYDSGHWSVC